ncbi:MAG: NUDIX hydrolase [Anaerolineales bacterium]|nr:NUDIX hydrolase [Anaerolineales bacterium]
MNSWKTLSRTTILDHSIYLRVENHVIELPDGRILDKWPWVIARDFVNVIPVTDDGRILVFRQGKYGYQGTSIAPVGGYLEPGESPLEAARRELLEELGYQAREMIALNTTLMAPNLGFSTGNPFIARQLRFTGSPESDDLEEQELLEISLDELETALLEGAIKVTSWYASFANALLWLKHEES